MVIENLETLKPVTLPALYLNREGDPEPVAVQSMERAQTSVPTELSEQSEAAALDGLRRALSETGQLIVMPHDGLSRISFTGVGDPKRLFVESIPGEDPFPGMDFDVQGRLCSLSQAEALLTRLYRGESSAALSTLLGNRTLPFS